MADIAVEHELCGNCKREIPQSNYVMHTAHCARNITLCKSCNEPIAKAKYEEHAKKCVTPVRRSPKQKTPEPPKTNLEKSPYFQSRKEVEDKKIAERKARYLERHEKLLDDTSKNFGTHPQSLSSVAAKSTQVETTLKAYQSTAVGTASRIMSNGTGAVKKEEPRSNGAVPKTSGGLMPCRYCDLELPKMELEEHENYCGSRTDRCLDCGELVMYKHKQVHLDTNHGFLKLNDEPGPKPSWDSATQKTNSPPRRRRFEPTIYTDFSQFDPTDYLPSNYRIPKPKIEKGESYKEISRRLDCPAQTPPRHSKKPRSTCKFCDIAIYYHNDLIKHQSVCRPKSSSRRTSDSNFNDPPKARSTVQDNKNCVGPQTGAVPKRYRPRGMNILIFCENCKTSIHQKDFTDHQTSNCGSHKNLPEARPLKQGFEKYVAPQLGSLPKVKRISISREFPQNNKHRTHSFTRSSDFQNDFPIPETKNHVGTKSRRKSKKSTPSDKPEAEHDSIKDQSPDETELDIDIPCEFCNEPILADYLILHQTGCRPDLAKKEVTDEDLATQEVKLPCEFCDELIYEFDLILHESGCMLQSVKKEATVEDAATSEKLASEFCDKPKPKNDSILHENGCIPDLVKKEVTDKDAATPGEKIRSEVCGKRKPEVLILRGTGCVAKKEGIEEDAATSKKLSFEFCGEPKPKNDSILHKNGCIPDLVKKEVTDEDAATPGKKLRSAVLILRRTGCVAKKED